jgi:hypothetical protein
VAERLKAPVLKTGRRQRLEGSNPPSSAKWRDRRGCSIQILAVVAHRLCAQLDAAIAKGRIPMAKRQPST